MRRFTTALLASTCLVAVATVSARATPFDEGSVPGGDFPDIFADIFDLPVGTTSVTGSLSLRDIDFFRFTGLVPGGTFDASFGSFFNLLLLIGDGGTVVDSFFGDGTFADRTIPASGQVNFGVSQSEGGEEYSLSFSAPLQPPPTDVPEPATLALAGAGLAGLGLLRWRDRKKPG